MAEVGKDLWRSSVPTPLLEQGHLQLLAQGRLQAAVEGLQGGRPQDHSGPVPHHPHSKEVLPDVQMELFTL